MNGNLRKLIKLAIPPALLLSVVLIVWDGLVLYTKTPAYLVPRPLDVVDVFSSDWNTLLWASLRTALAALLGLSISTILGTLTACLFSQFRWIRSSCYPYVIFFNTVPIVALAPLVIIWFDAGLHSIVLITSILTLFPIITSTTTGLLAAERHYHELFQLYNASRWQTLWKLQFPFAVRYLINGIQTACGLSIVGAVIGEHFAGQQSNAKGLGYLIFATQGQLKVDRTFAAILCSTLLGIVLFGTMTLLSNTLLKRWYAHSSEA